MTNFKTTKRALVSSVLALVMCFSMLLGTTFAWFTDSVTSSGNIIQTGTLDVKMEWKDATATGAQQTYKDASEGAIFNSDKWEPGYVEAKNIKISNVGTLALKYNLTIAANGEVSKLADVIEVYFAKGEHTLASRDMSELKKIGTLSDVLAGMPDNMSGELAEGEVDNGTIAFKLPESVGNEYQGLSIGTDFSLVLMATQDTVESDSFDNQYDDLADNVVTVETSEELTALLSDTTLSGNVTIMLANDLTVDASVTSLPSGATYNFVSADGSDVSVTFAATTLNVTSDVNVDEGVTLNAGKIHVKEDSDVVVSGTLDATEINLWHETKGETLTVTETGTLTLDSSIAGYHDDAIIIEGTYTGKGIMIISGLIEITGENAKVTGTGDIQAVCESVLKITDNATVGLDGKISVYDNYPNYYRTGTVVIDNATVTAGSLRVNYENKSTAPELDTMNMTITNGATVTVTDTATVYAGGNLYVSDGASLTAGTLTVKDGGVMAADSTSKVEATTTTGTVAALSNVATAEELTAALSDTTAANKVVVLTNDVAISDVTTISTDIILNLNGNKLDASANTSRPIELTEGASLTINAEGAEVVTGEYGLVNMTNADLTINGGSFTGNITNGAFLKIAGDQDMTVTLNNVTVKGTDPQSRILNTVGVSADNLTVNINGGDYEAGMGGNWINGTIDGATIVATNSDNMWPCVCSYGTVTVKNSTLKAAQSAIAVAAGCTITVENCTIEAPETGYAFQVMSSGGTITVDAATTYTGQYGTTGKISSECPDAVIIIDGVEVYRKSAQ